MIIASVVLTTMIIWMAQNKNISEELKSKAKVSYIRIQIWNLYLSICGSI